MRGSFVNSDTSSLTPLERIRASEQAMKEAFTQDELWDLGVIWQTPLRYSMPLAVEQVLDRWHMKSVEDARLVLDWYYARPLSVEEVRRYRRFHDRLDAAGVRGELGTYLNRPLSPAETRIFIRLAERRFGIA